ncbi:uncharacterized protein LOC122395045 [Colletes gigas]|uniref:uncharacterized protein LOC122395045 n=1 Tax=Colletes gigas TaxID=935657 RepID=UPI001C9AA2EE|nr:uncharacterized protein LOC122395045 [Colletes gigas]XP_043248287.1 uncharacterized protein LOC122395045 [Colletes gigas]
MKNSHPLITAATSSPVNPDSSSPNEPTEPCIRLKLDKPLHWEWELTTTADTLPVIQLLGKDGRLLVETTGKTAQRARGSFREGLKTYEQFPTSKPASEKTTTASSSLSSSSSSIPAPIQGNRNIDGFSTKFGGYEFGYRPRKSKSEVTVKEKEKKSRNRRSGEPEATVQRNEQPKTSSKRYSVGDYLRQQIIDDLRTKSTLGKCPEEIAKERCKKMKAYLRSQSETLSIEPEEENRVTESKINGDEVPSQRIKDGLKELRETIGEEEPRLEVSNDVPWIDSKEEPSRTDGSVFQRGENRIGNEELERVRAFLRRKLQQKMEEHQRSASSSRCDELGRGIEKRYSDYGRNERPGGYRTRKVRSETNVIRFDPEAVQKDRQRERSRNGRTRSEDSSKGKVYRSRSDAILEASRQKSQTRESEKRKLYRKTKSDVLLGQIGGGVDSEQDFANPPRRIRSQDNVDESWREYKERKRHERMHRESERDANEEDFMSKPRWKDLQADLCPFRNCRVCQNLLNCVNPLQERGIPEDRPRREATATLNDSSSDRPSTSLQENYLVVDRGPGNPKKQTLVENLARNRGFEAVNAMSPDCGYNTIPKKAFKDYRDLYTRSNVKKSNTFKIVDGSEDPEEEDQIEPKGEFDEGLVDSFGCSNGDGLLTNKSNEDIAKDYFKRVYELLKKRQEEARKIQEGEGVPGCDDSSSSNYVEKVQKKRLRRKKRDRSAPGEEIVTVPPTSGGQDSWKVQTLSLSTESPSNRRKGCRPQVQAVSAGKRTRPAPPPPPISCKVNAKDINKYFDWPNKENTPGNAVNAAEGTNEAQLENEQPTMGSNLSRHNGKGLTGRRTQSSGNLCEPKGKLNTMGKILVPCSSAQRERYKFCGSLPNHLDDKDTLDDDQKENNNIMTDTITGNLGGTLPHKKRSLGVHFSDGGPTGALDLVKHRSQDSVDENDPWRYQQSDLDLVRCRHGNFDSVSRNRSTDAVSGDLTRRYSRGSSLDDRCHRNSDLDLVGTLPRRKQDARNCGKVSETNSSSSQTSNPDGADNDLLMQIVHKPDCELVRHRQQLSKCIDLKLSKLAGGEPQDQGYASERSPEDEHPPSLPGQPFPNITPESTFRVTLQKSSRGLGLSVSGGGTAGPVRVKRLFPQQPAALSNKLQPGDILLAANGTPLTGLTNYEALEVLRTTRSTVELVVCRLPGDTNVTPPGAPPPPPARREPPPPLRILNPLPPLQIEPCGEFDIEMTKVGGSLGFTLRKADSSALGHYVRALVREPALSDGRIRPGDKIVAVDGAPLSPMSHEEAVQLLRQCGPTVRLRLYRDLAQTPVSALSPTEPDHPLRPPRTSLRQEAVDMLCDLAVRKLSPGTSSGSSCKQSPGASCNSPRRLRRLATRTPTENDQEALEKHSSVHTTSTASQAETSDSDQCSIRTQITNSQPNTPGTDIIDPPPLYDVCDSSDSSKAPARPSFLDLSAPQGKPHFQFCSLDSDLEYPGGDGIVAEDELNKTTGTDYRRREANGLSSDEHDNDLPSEPASMPPVLSSTSTSSTAAFSYKNPAYQSANPACGAGIDATAKNKATHSSDQDIPGKILGTEDPAGSKGLLKWKGVMFAPDDGIDKTENEEEKVGKDTTDSAAPSEELEQGTEVFMVELTRGWNSRLGFSLQPEGNHTVISVVHPDSVAAKDGRLKQGDVLMMVNDESVKDMSTADIIDLLRKIRGSIGITVMRRNKRDNVT